MADDRAWASHARDAMIAGHVQDRDELWTANPRGFLAVGLDARHLVDVLAVAAPVPDG